MEDILTGANQACRKLKAEKCAVDNMIEEYLYTISKLKNLHESCNTKLKKDKIKTDNYFDSAREVLNRMKTVVSNCKALLQNVRNLESTLREERIVAQELEIDMKENIQTMNDLKLMCNNKITDIQKTLNTCINDISYACDRDNKKKVTKKKKKIKNITK